LYSAEGNKFGMTLAMERTISRKKLMPLGIIGAEIFEFKVSETSRFDRRHRAIIFYGELVIVCGTAKPLTVASMRQFHLNSCRRREVILFQRRLTVYKLASLQVSQV
jgi:hypothetical protein